MPPTFKVVVAICAAVGVTSIGEGAIFANVALYRMFSRLVGRTEELAVIMLYEVVIH